MTSLKVAIHRVEKALLIASGQSDPYPCGVDAAIERDAWHERKDKAVQSDAEDLEIVLDAARKYLPIDVCARDLKKWDDMIKRSKK